MAANLFKNLNSGAAMAARALRRGELSVSVGNGITSVAVLKGIKVPFNLMKLNSGAAMAARALRRGELSVSVGNGITSVAVLKGIKVPFNLMKLNLRNAS